MEFNWYNIFNLTEWYATQLVSRKTTFFLDGIGQKEVLITQGNETAITIDDVFLPLQFAGKNPYQIGAWAVYVDVNSEVWLGKAVA